jgi:hypothetical protein
MSNFDLIDDYLTNRLQGSERSEFEASMNADPALKSEVEQQRLVIQTIQKAGATELKAMLNKVPVGGAVSLWGDWSVVRMAATIGVAGLLGTALYFYMKDSGNIIPAGPNAADVKIDSLIPKKEDTEEAVKVEEEEKKEEEKKPIVNAPKVSKSKKKAAVTPKVEVNDPSAELLSEEEKEAVEASRPAISMATIEVQSKTSPTYSFHYQFSDKKLFLYGPFDGYLYEIIEVHGDNHALFLYFKDNFYHLDESRLEVTELTPIRDRALTQKLKEFRTKK